MDEFQATLMAILSGGILFLLYTLMVMGDVFMGDEKTETDKED